MFKADHKMSYKIEKILKAYNSVSFPPTIMSGWKESGLNFVYAEGIITRYSFDRNRVISKLKE